MVDRIRFMKRPASGKTAQAKTRRASGKGEEELAALAWGIAHPARAAILRILIERGECVCGAIVDSMPLAQATVSQHLKVLRDTGWIEGEIDGPRVCYCPTAGAMARFKQLLQGLESGERR
ncbi:MAG TPA: metalloregulator ArsR/SmtB family transcription factor [Candidatus Eisenbacteria bacterium]|nr:metalloregulator ArsR/SmtB family transcription factor [Candidatus Eisenbacteria bacterium]